MGIPAGDALHGKGKRMAGKLGVHALSLVGQFGVRAGSRRNEAIGVALFDPRDE